MKTLCLLPLSLLFFTIHAFGQNTWTVDNNPDSTADFTSLIEAIDSASAGDVILVHGSNTSYGTINLSKSLKIYGTGYFLSKNPNTQPNNSSSSISKFTFSTGSASSIIRGLVIEDEIRIIESNITVQNCHVTSTNVVGIQISYNPIPSNIVISGCYLPSDDIHIGNSTNVVLFNNYVGRDIQSYNGSQAIISNNVIYSAIGAHNSLVQNNIIYGGASLAITIIQSKITSQAAQAQPITATSPTLT